ncbi:MAG: hypothetical protein LC775_13090, partial [Acidobacteria bacterium]|nr:hypothetical protein [Acidobacteriota bacterium]
AEDPADTERFIKKYWPVMEVADHDGTVNYRALAPPLKESEVRNTKPVTEGGDLDWQEDLHDTTRKLLPLRFNGYVAVEDWKERMPSVLAQFVIDLARGLDEEKIFGDILGFLPTGRTIEEVCEKIRAALGDRADVYGLLSRLSNEEKDAALSPRRKGDKRKIVISTNLAETSLTVEGVRFVVDSGLIAQSEWDPKLATGAIPTKPHSQSGIKQRWGRVGRKAPGWVFPLYTKHQFAQLDEDIPPGSARENLESLIMTTRVGGIDRIKDFPWPAAFLPAKTTVDDAAKEARNTFLRELDRADIALQLGGAVDADGHPTSFGKELIRFSGLGSTASALAIMYADRLACVPEVSTILSLLEDTRLIGRKCLLQDDYEWPDEWRVEAANRHRGLASLAEDDAHLALLICGAWERADPTTPPWEPSAARRDWARRWWINDDVLLASAKQRQEVLAALSPAMKEDVKRFVEPALLDRARGVIARTLRALVYRLDGHQYVPAGASRGTGVVSAEPPPESPLRFEVERDSLMPRRHERVIALRRREGRSDERYISNFVAVVDTNNGAEPTGASPSGLADAMAMVVDFKRHARPDSSRDRALGMIESWPVGQRIQLTCTDGEQPG